MSKIWSFLDPKSLFLIFSMYVLLRFSKIIPDKRHYKEGTTDIAQSWVNEFKCYIMGPIVTW